MRAGHRELDILPLMLPRLLDYDHRSVFQISDALPRLVAGPDDADRHLFAGQNHRLERRLPDREC